MSDKQANEGSWDTDFPPETENQGGEKSKGGNNSGKGRLPYMKFDKPGEYTVRLVGKHVKFQRHWKPFTERVITDEAYKGKDPAWNAGFYPRETFAIHIIDRADGQLKILEKGRSLFKCFAREKAVNEIDPAGREGSDFVITVAWPNGNKMQATYQANAKKKASPFTEEEIANFKAKKAPLKDMYSSTPLEKIQQLWDALPDSEKVAPKKEAKGSKESKVTEAAVEEAPAPKIEESMPEAPAEKSKDEDLFGDDEENKF